MIEDKISKFRREEWENRILGLSNDDGHPMSKVNKLLGGNTSFKEVKLKDLNGDRIGSKVTCEEFRKFYQSLYSKKIPNCIELTEVENCLKRIRNFNRISNFNRNNSANRPKSYNKFTNWQEVGKLIKSIKGKNSAGHDGISNKMIRHLPLRIIKQLSIIFNQCINNGYFPNQWKTAIVICSRNYFTRPWTVACDFMEESARSPDQNMRQKARREKAFSPLSLENQIKMKFNSVYN